MKKCVAATLAILIGISSVAYGAPKTIETFEQPDFLIKVNDEFKYHPEGLKPLVYGDRTYLPAAYIAELLGAKVSKNTGSILNLIKPIFPTIIFKVGFLSGDIKVLFCAVILIFFIATIASLKPLPQ